MDIPVKESLSALVTLIVAMLGYFQWKRTKRTGRFIEDREVAYNIATTGATPAMPASLLAANEAYEAARESVIEGFRRAMGAGQI